ncbi:MAG: amidohydrolase family protein [Candidatus Eisenbacteria bacterium]|uniref:Amidohydrolase family protein n=1 Tax=Eiseniibacteriota bacterium TaxID=2212470 RepID=A0A7Y2E8S6_UNCEI|nr:amidohydrolase family protein [Candidatus Eisenbacteria bacterium]
MTGMTQPGAVNAHTHLYSGLAPLGLPAPAKEPESFVQILESIWWRLDRALDEPSLRASARYYIGEALLAGTTGLVDHHESPNFIEGSLDVIADACQDMGVRAVLCYGATERNGGREEAKRGLLEGRRFIKANRRPLVKGVIGLHAGFTVSDETIREAGNLCRELDTVLHVHVAEDASDVADARDRGYTDPVDRLVKLGALPEGSILAHGIHLTPSQVRMAADRGAWFVQNPRSNRGNKVGYPSALNQTDRVALGSDGYPAVMSDELDVFREEAEAHGDLPARGQKALVQGRTLLESFFADVIDNDTVTQERGEPLPRRVTVGGKAVVKDGRLVTADLHAVRNDAQREAVVLWERMRALA